MSLIRTKVDTRESLAQFHRLAGRPCWSRCPEAKQEEQDCELTSPNQWQRLEQCKKKAMTLLQGFFKEDMKVERISVSASMLNFCSQLLTYFKAEFALKILKIRTMMQNFMRLTAWESTVLCQAATFFVQKNREQRYIEVPRPQGTQS